MGYFLYVIELDKEFTLTSKAKKENPNTSMDKPCIYRLHVKEPRDTVLSA
jgi:hypothetical protein